MVNPAPKKKIARNPPVEVTHITTVNAAEDNIE